MKNIINKLIKPKVTADKIWDWFHNRDYRGKWNIRTLPSVKYQYDDDDDNYIASNLAGSSNILYYRNNIVVNLDGNSDIDRMSLSYPLCTEGKIYPYSDSVRLNCLTTYAYMWYFSITGKTLFDDELTEGSLLPKDTKKYYIISKQIDRIYTLEKHPVSFAKEPSKPPRLPKEIEDDRIYTLEKHPVSFAGFGAEDRYYLKEPSKPPRLPKEIEDFLEVIWYAYGILPPCCISGMQDRDLKEMKKWRGAGDDKMDYEIVKQFYSYDAKKNHNYIPKNLGVRYDNKNMRYSIYTDFYIWKGECWIDGELYCTPLTKQYIEKRILDHTHKKQKVV